jgi:hypothetical protein
MMETATTIEYAEVGHAVKKYDIQRLLQTERHAYVIVHVRRSTWWHQAGRSEWLENARA